MKDTARLAAYFAGIVLIGAFGGPPLFWLGQSLASLGVFVFLEKVSFESFFHRALLVAAILLLWPLLRSLQVRSWRDLGLVPAARPARDFASGFLLSAVPFLCGAAILLLIGTYTIRATLPWKTLPFIVLTSLVVPVLEETLFRGFILGVFLRTNSRIVSVIATSVIFAAVHFLKAPENTTTSDAVTWTSGWDSVANAFWQFRDPMLLLAGFTTLFLIACILADARLRTRALWLPMGLHAGWIFVNTAFSKAAHREVLALPWVGKNLLVGIVPLTVGLVTWALLHFSFKHENARRR